MNLGQFRTSVDRLTGVAVDQTTQNEWVNFVLAELALEENWPWLEKSTTITLVANQASYSLPSDCRAVFSVIDTVNAAQANGVARDGTAGQPIFSGTSAATMTLAMEAAMPSTYVVTSAGWRLMAL